MKLSRHTYSGKRQAMKVYAPTNLRPFSRAEDDELDRMAAVLRDSRIAFLQQEEARLIAEKKAVDGGDCGE